ncbi:ATP-dependent DNA helicase [Paraburkholderia oxyphila]|uniref:ATP-dependent DNA helicase n=1 Tax=Paraburkholderia oxyphila TaxID=614212 RepID=UPI000485C277|nr:AAA family ATPase [Paraburkholderia oxyphila]
MTPPPTVTVRVSTIRSQNPFGRSGAIFTGVEVDSQGWRVDTKKHYVVKASNQVLQAAVERGQLWSVSGTPEANTIVVNGYQITEATIVATAMQLLRPSGEYIITVLGEGEAFAGIGQVKARRLWDQFGQELYAILDRGDVSRLVDVLPRRMAEQLAEAWSHWGDTFTLQWLQSKGLPVPLGRKLLAFFKRDAATKIEEDPYRLISFAASWKTVDTLARRTFGIEPDDPRRLTGGLDEALHAAFDAGHTCVGKMQFKRRVAELLPGVDDIAIDAALSAAEQSGRLIRRAETLHAPGPYLMECTVVQAIVERLTQPDPLLDDASLESLVNAYVKKVRADVGDPGFQLNVMQREALTVANAKRFSIITGGAGTGKTTVLRALFRICDAAGLAVYPMALSGRAAKRIGEATGLKAQTIAGFLKNFAPDDAPQKAVAVIDEASMVDLPSIYRVIRCLPSEYRIVLVGDPHQLPPVGPGLLLHELAHDSGIPIVELAEVRRYGGEIARAAASIRAGKWPELPGQPENDIAFIPCAPSEVNGTVLRLYGQDRAGSQILCATRNALAGGTRPINAQSQQSFNREGEELMLWNIEHDLWQGTGFRVGDPVICLKNDWEIDLQNGSVGIVLSVASQMLGEPTRRSLGQIHWDDGRVRDLTADLLNHLELAYAITIHKSQGSAFRRVILPVTASKLLDRTLLYTAVTRAEKQVILVGDVDAARKAVLAQRRSDGRQVAMRGLLRERVDAIAPENLAKE